MLELASRRARSSGGYQKDGPKPVPQGLSSLVKDGVGSDRGLMSTMSTLIQFAGFDEIGPIMATTRTAEPVWPFTPDDIPQTITFCAKPPTELPGCHRSIHDSPPLHSGCGPTFYDEID